MTSLQKLGLMMALLGAIAGAGTQLNDILSPLGASAPIIVKIVVSAASFGSMLLGVIFTFMTGQTSQVQAVRSMPGVEQVAINGKANPALALLAVDPTETKIVPSSPGAQAQIEATVRATQ